MTNADLVIVNFDVTANKLHRLNCIHPRRSAVYPKWRVFKSEKVARCEGPGLTWCSVCVGGVNESLGASDDVRTDQLTQPGLLWGQLQEHPNWTSTTLAEAVKQYVDTSGDTLPMFETFVMFQAVMVQPQISRDALHVLDNLLDSLDVLDNLLGSLDEEYEEPYQVDLTAPTERMQEAERAFLDVVLSEMRTERMQEAERAFLDVVLSEYRVRAYELVPGTESTVDLHEWQRNRSAAKTD